MKVRDKLVHTASVLFHKQGYNSTGINQIIDEAGIAKGSFYYNFKSKEALCIAFLNYRHEYWFTALKQYIKSNVDHQQAVLSAFDFLISMNQKENFRGCSFLNILSELHEDDSEILEVIRAHKQDLRKYINGLLEHGKLSDHVYLLFESAIIESQLFRDQWPVNKAKNIVESLIK